MLYGCPVIFHISDAQGWQIANPPARVGDGPDGLTPLFRACRYAEKVLVVCTDQIFWLAMQAPELMASTTEL